MGRLALLLGAMVGCWILLMPPSSGPDEPIHLIRSAALVRGDFEGTPSERTGASKVRTFDVPGWVGGPSPDCYKHQELVPATCSTRLAVDSDDSAVEGGLSQYPIWGYVLPGVATFVDARDPAWFLGRALGALPGVLLVAASLALARRHGALAASGVLIAMTPMAWFTLAVVNPSGPAIAGGIALWTVLLTHRPPVPAAAGSSRWRASRSTGWFAALAFIALVSTRRDGPVWLGLILGLLVLGADERLLARWRWLGRGPQIAVVAATVASVVWLASSSGDNIVSAAGFLVPPIAVGLRSAWDRLVGQRTLRLALAVVGGVGVAGAAIVLASRHGQGVFRVDLFRKIVGESGLNLQEALGLLGWLDTPVPLTAQFAFWMLLGALATAAWLTYSRGSMLLALGIVATAVVSSWIMEFALGGSTGVYWQGRYYLPLLVGVPIVLATWRREALAGEHRLGAAVIVGSLVVVNVALFAAVRRFGVGTLGALTPWNWDTYGTPLPVVVLLALHVAASALLVRELLVGWADRAAGAVDGGEDVAQPATSAS